VDLQRSDFLARFILMLLSSIGISCRFSLIQAHGVVHLKGSGAFAGRSGAGRMHHQDRAQSERRHREGPDVARLNAVAQAREQLAD
jgi:hypothetical protein